MARYEIVEDGVHKGFFDLSTFPGCCKICISHNLRILPAFQHQGTGKRAQKQRMLLAKSLGYKIILATVNDKNKAQEKILTKYGWRRVTFYDNHENGNRIALWYRNLDDPYEEAQGENMGCR